MKNPTRRPKNLNELAVEIVEGNRKNGWDVTSLGDWPVGQTRATNPEKLASKLALIHSEVSEALEEVRRGTVSGLAEKLADVIIRVLDMSGGLGLDIEEALLSKVAKNRTRGYRHGGKAI